ncbi:MAG: hypothetical protein ACLUVG_19005 [Phocaeicola vulgatus]
MNEEGSEYEGSIWVWWNDAQYIPISFIGIGIIANTYEVRRQVKYAKIRCVCSLVTVLVMYWANSQCPIENIMSYTLPKSFERCAFIWYNQYVYTDTSKFLLKSLSWIG